MVQTGGAVYLADEVAKKAQDDLSTAYTDAAGRESTRDITGDDLGNLSTESEPLLPGVYTASSSLGLTGNLYLYADNPNDAFIFQIGSTLTTTSYSNIVLLGEATFCQVYWQVGSSATLGTYSTFLGHILAWADITATTSAEMEGQLLALNGAVTLDTNTIINDVCLDVAPAICVKKYVSVEGGETWHDAQSEPGLSAEVGSEVQFKFVVTNTGNVDLTDITLSDDVYDLSGAVLTDPLPVGDSFEYILPVTAGGGTASKHGYCYGGPRSSDLQ